MNKGKKLYIFIVEAIISVFFIWFVLLDLSRFDSLDLTYDIFPSGILKRTAVLLVSSVAWLTGRDGLGSRDSNMMRYAFLFACLGEAAFALGQRSFGLAMFFICQTLLIIRNSQGFSSAIRLASVLQRKRLLIVSVIISLVYGSVLAYSVHLTAFNAEAAAVYLYWSILNLSLLSAIACFILLLLPKRNAALACSGVFCFYCCDVLVGLDAALEPGLPWLTANSFIWIFYIPALLLLALSCYSYR